MLNKFVFLQSLSKPEMKSTTSGRVESDYVTLKRLIGFLVSEYHYMIDTQILLDSVCNDKMQLSQNFSLFD